ncbi:AAA family ATPase [Streptosporangium sp. 'caverna']|uniref:AAA family ATPase n=1 Tax=Streptosporangium sp. 'caverna' TaxID=2202249 RepID=UPI000D7D7133|nr:AAA family ATPase [Streptosporangium sp. 'caverna']AWS48681.1 hypothetical protein DKM19_24800 [Streptosporangium sp. 'caverna']
MTTHLRLRELIITTRNGDFSYPLSSPVTAIVGPVAAGKSTMLEVIKHVLGGSAILTQVIEEHVLRAQLKIEVGERQLILQRATQGRARTVDIYEASSGEQIGSFPTREGTPVESLSRQLLRALGIPALSITRSRTKATSATSSLTFNDIFSFVYLQQAEIDRSVVGHTEYVREPKRRATFELLFGLTNSELIGLEVQRGQLADALRAAHERANTVKTFLQEASVSNEQQLLAERQQVLAEWRDAQARLGSLRNEVEQLSVAEDALREEIRIADKEGLAIREATNGASAAIARRSALIAQLEVDIQRQERLMVAARRLAPIEFRVCPRCLQSLSGRDVPADHCLVCLQPDATDEANTTAERNEAIDRLESQISETRELLADDQLQLVSLNDHVRGQELLVASLRSELDARTRDFVSPRFEYIASSAAMVATLEARLTMIEQLTSYWDQYRELEGDIAALSEDARRTDEQIEVVRGQLAARRERVNELSVLFDEIVRFLEVPWYESARIDPKTYLPIVNGRPFDKLSVAGGMKTIVNLAYHLSLITYCIPRNDTYLPDLLVIDSPRKNIGTGSADKALTDRIYRRFRMLADLPGSPVQILIADNDLPAIASDFVHKISIDNHENPFVPDVAHPGPDAVERIGAEAAQEPN